MYGIMFPYVFIAAFFAIVSLIIRDKLALAYWHRKPRNFDSKQVERMLFHLMYAPLAMAGVAYWFYG